MKKSKFTVGTMVFLILFIVGYGFLMWGVDIMYNYENFKEINRAAFQEAKGPYMVGLVFMGLAFVWSFRKK